MSNQPTRIQLRRTKGWRKPEGAVVVARPTKWGNPFPVGSIVENKRGYIACLYSATSIALYRLWILQERDQGRLDLSELRGKDLCCWCPLDRPCHADILLELANR